MFPGRHAGWPWSGGSWGASVDCVSSLRDVGACQNEGLVVRANVGNGGAPVHLVTPVGTSAPGRRMASVAVVSRSSPVQPRSL